MAPGHPVGSSVHTPLVPCTGCRERTTGSCATNLLEAAQKTHGPQDSIALPERAPKLQKSGELLGFLGPWLPWSLPYVVWSGLHELVITLRGLRGAHSQASITASCVGSAFLLLHVRLHAHLLTAFADAAILCCKHTAWSLGGLSSPG